MSTQSFWQGVLAGLKALVDNIEKEVARGVNLFLSVLGTVITAEENILMADAMPIVQKIALNLQNEQPGLDAVSFISALIAASVPVLEAEGIKLAHTAISIVASSAAHQLNVTNTAGNAGNVSTTPTV